jgi:CRP-like cAMP-binding protein
MPDSSTHLANIKNHILRSISADALERLLPSLELVEMPHGMTVYEAKEQIDQVYLPNNAVVSVVSMTESGQVAEAGLIGWEGVTGIEALLNGPVAINHYIVQLQGPGYRADLAAIKEEFSRSGSFHEFVLKFTRSMLAQMSQTALCNRLHVAEQRLSKWLLMCRDRSDTDVLAITQEFAALMLGSNRVTLTQAAGQLQDKGFIEYKRGNITVLNRKGLESFACECYGRIKDEYNRYTRAG